MTWDPDDESPPPSPPSLLAPPANAPARRPATLVPAPIGTAPLEEFQAAAQKGLLLEDVREQARQAFLRGLGTADPAESRRWAELWLTQAAKPPAEASGSTRAVVNLISAVARPGPQPPVTPSPATPPSAASPPTPPPLALVDRPPRP